MSEKDGTRVGHIMDRCFCLGGQAHIRARWNMHTCTLAHTPSITHTHSHTRTHTHPGLHTYTVIHTCAHTHTHTHTSSCVSVCTPGWTNYKSVLFHGCQVRLQSITSLDWFSPLIARVRECHGPCEGVCERWLNREPLLWCCFRVPMYTAMESVLFNFKFTFKFNVIVYTIESWFDMADLVKMNTVMS